MKPRARFRFVLLTIIAVLGLAFMLSTARGQIRPPRPPGFNPPFNPPRINPPGFVPGPRMPGVGNRENVWICEGCKKELGRNLTVPPSTCPHCGARIINGVGNGVLGPGGKVTPNSIRPVNPPGFNPNPPGFNGGQPALNPPVNPSGINPPPLNVSDNAASNASASSSSSNGPLGGWKFIALIIGILVVGVFVLLGGTFLMIYTMKSNASTSRRHRRRRNDDDEYDRDRF